MKRVLIIYYSQSGEVEHTASQFAARLTAAGLAVSMQPITPRADYPYPWKSIRRFFDAMPESVLGHPPEIEPLSYDPDARFDLVVIAYPVWFLSPAPAIQGLFRSVYAAPLRDTDVVTITVSRAMWQQASERMKRLVAAAGGIHCDNVVISHQGSALLTLVSTPRSLLFGKSDSLMGIFPRAAVGENDRARVDKLALVLAQRLSNDMPRQGSYLAGEPAVSVKRWLVLPELMAWYIFFAWAAIIRFVGKISPTLRAPGVYLFAVFLVCLILVALPVLLVVVQLGFPLMRNWLNGYVVRLAAPTGEVRGE